MILAVYNAAVANGCGIVLLRSSVGVSQRIIQGDMTANQESRHVFIVRIWLEPRELEGAAPQLRGTIEHVPSGVRRSVKALTEIADFILSWLPALRHRPDTGSQPTRRKGDGAP